MEQIKLRLKIYMISLFIVIIFGITGFMIFEDLSLLDAFYFSIVTITTVGYGDIHPASPVSKILAILLILTGVGTFLGVIANATEMILLKRENKLRIGKMNMFIGLFFSEIGVKLLSIFSSADLNINKIRHELMIKAEWADSDFLKSKKKLKYYEYIIDQQLVSFKDLQSYLFEKRGLIISLLENPILLEHESFTELIRAIFHLAEELSYRKKFNLPDADIEHLKKDIIRVYSILINQWIDYIKYLKDYYPYLFSLAMRTNPFDKDASPIIK